MNAPALQRSRLSEQARPRFLAENKRPIFLGDWERALFIHYETDPELLRRQAPFELDLWHGAAIVSVVAFSMRRFRPAFAGRVLERIFRPAASHEFLNVRAYVRHAGRPGIFFMTEYVNNYLSLLLGPALYGLPYRYAKIEYQHHHELRSLTGRVANSFHYEGRILPEAGFQPCASGSLDEFLLERYSAYTCRNGIKHRFDIWHEPWPQAPADLVVEDSLLHQSGAWFDEAKRIGANYSPGIRDIWIGRPWLLDEQTN